MATSWYRDLGIGNYGSRMRVRVDVVRQDRAGNYTRVKVRIYAYNGSSSSRTYNQGSGAAVAVSGDVSHSARATFSINAGAWGTLVDWEFNVPHGADGRKSFSITGHLSDTGTSALGNGGSITVTGTFSPLYLAPTTPSWGSTAYQDPSQVRVAWNNRDTARGAYTSIRVERWARSTGAWFHRAVLSGSATSYTDTSLSSNNEHRWRVRAEGPGGTSAWVEGGTLGTTPAAATGVTAVKAAGGVAVSWTDNAAPTNRPRTFYIDDNPDGTGWVRVGSIGGSATSWTHTDADPAVTHQYRVWTRITSQIDLTSPASDPSEVLQLQAAPRQPRREAPLDGVTQVIGETITLQWKHVPVDTTPQEQAEVEWWLDDGESTVATVSGAVNTLDVTPGPDGARAQLQWRVRTRGAHPDWSPWSTTNGPLVSTPPSITVQTPEHLGALPTSRVSTSWAYTPGGAEPQLQQTAWTVRLTRWATGDVLEEQEGGTSQQVDLATRLDDATEYALLIAARNGDGLWSGTEVVRFTTDFPLPHPVLCFPIWDHDTATISVGFEEHVADGHTAVEAIDVERRDDGGDWVLIASGVSQTTNVTDRTPRIGQVEYRAISRTTLPTETVGPTALIAWSFPIEGVYVSGGDGFGRVCTAMGAEASDEPGIEQTSHRFAGIAKPVAFFGTGQEHRLTFAGTIPLPPNPTPVSTREEWVELLHEYGVVCYRDPVGRKRFGLLSVSFSQSGPLESLSLEIEEVAWSEGVQRISDRELEAML